MSVIYRKYRPQNFSAVVGQNHIKTTLAGEISSGHLAHAYLFVGPRGTGKTTLARLFARAVNCLERKEGDFEPCNKCETCLQIMNQRSLDIVEIDAATHTQVDNVRENIITNAQVPPYNSKGYKVFIIDEVHMLSKAAFNALLKIIEEPPKHAIFILATTEIRKVPETVISRCQRFDLKKIPQQQIIDRMQSIINQEKVAMPTEVLVAIARRSEGCMRDAESLLGQLVGLAENNVVSQETAAMVFPQSHWSEIETLVEFLHRRDVAGALQHIHKLINEGLDIDDFTSDLLEYIRHIVLSKSIGIGYTPDFEENAIAKIKDFASRFSATELISMLDIFMAKAYDTRSAMIPQLPLELGIIEVCQVQDTAMMPEVKKRAADQPRSTVSDSVYSLEGQWAKILTQVKDFNHSLSAFLKVGHPLSLKDNVLVIGFEYDFHAERVRELKNKKTAEDAISNILGEPIRLEAVVDNNYRENHQKFNGSGDRDVEEVLDLMGGEVV